MKTIKLTKAESDVWNWAQSAAQDFWSDDDGRDDGLHFDACPVGHAANGTASILNNADVISDMIYRIGTQLPDMASEQGSIGCNGNGDTERMSALSIIAIARRIELKLKSIL